MKKILALLCFSLLFAAFNYPKETIGEAVFREDGLLYISGIGLTEDALDEVLLYIDGAEIYDLRTGFLIGPEEIFDGDTLRVVYDDDQALTIYAHAGEPESADFMVVVSDNIWYSDEGCFFVTQDGKYRVTLTEDILLLDENGYGMFFDEIVPGMEMFVWAAFVTASFPGQVVPEKIVLLR